MGALLLSFLSINMQYLCSAALILICALAGIHLYLMLKRKTDEPRATDAAPSEQNDSAAEEPSDETMEEPAEEPSDEESEELAEVFSDDESEELAEVFSDNESEELAEAFSDDESEELAEEIESGEVEIVALPMSGKKLIRSRYSKSFTAKLIQSPDPVKQYYVDLANDLFSYKKTRNRISWANSSFYIGRQAVSKFSIRGKTLYLYLALDPNDFLNTKYFVKDASAVKRYEAVPLGMKVKSGRGVKFGKELIEILMQKIGVPRLEGAVERIKLSDYPYDSTKNLLARGLIKLKIGGELPQTDANSPDHVDFEKHEQVSVAEAEDLISDEVAVSFVEEADEEQTVLAKPKGIINIDTLSKNYEANETVTLESLKEKKLIGNSVNYVKVLARGVLNKPLIVKMPEFSVDAVKMILLTGGKVIKLKTKRD